jgi:3-dehydroquinate dehydratase type I
MSSKLCLPLSGTTTNMLSIIDQLNSNHDMIEFRADLVTSPNTPEEAIPVVIPHAKQLGLQIIATCRELLPSTTGDVVGGFSQRRKDIMLKCIDAGATHVDIEVESPEDYCQEIVTRAKSKGCLVIISHHNFEQTEEASLDLQQRVEECFQRGADIAKIAVAVISQRGAARVLSLYNDDRSIVALAMGSLGICCRITACMLGSPFTFVAWDERSATAPGQLTRESLIKIYNEINFPKPNTFKIDNSNDNNNKRLKQI